MRVRLSASLFAPFCGLRSQIRNRHSEFLARGPSSVGRAPALQAGCQGLESATEVLHILVREPFDPQQGVKPTIGNALMSFPGLKMIKSCMCRPGIRTLAGVCHPKRGRPPKTVHPLDLHYQNLQREMLATIQTLQLAA